jgi:7-cyano-7-deazaguanine synthase in queuosine biosynthesis
MDDQTTDYADRLVEVVRQFDACVVAYSGGVDSAVVAKAAQLALGDRAVAITGVSASLATGELDAAKRLPPRLASAMRLLPPMSSIGRSTCRTRPIAASTVRRSSMTSSAESPKPWAFAQF